MHYYDGLPSGAPLVARSSTTPWLKGRSKYLSPARAYTDFASAWDDRKSALTKQLFSILDDLKVPWNCIDVIQIAYRDDGLEPYIWNGDLPTIMWIGVPPGTLSPEAGIEAVVQCKAAILFHGIEDGEVEVEIRETWVFAGGRTF